MHDYAELSGGIYCNECNYGYQSLRPFYNGRAIRNTSNNAFKTGSDFPNPGTATTGTNNNEFSNNYFSIPDYTNAIADNAGQFATALIPAPGIGRNTFPGPSYRDIDMNLAKSFGLPKMRVLGESAKIEIKANFLSLFNMLNIDPTTNLHQHLQQQSWSGICGPGFESDRLPGSLQLLAISGGVARRILLRT